MCCTYVCMYSLDETFLARSALITRALLVATLLTQNVESPLYNYLYQIPLPHALPQASYAYDRPTQCDLQ